MNMISTGAFQAEMDASTKTERLLKSLRALGRKIQK